MKENRKILLIVSNGFFMQPKTNDYFLKHFPKRIPTWIDCDFEITDSILNRKSNEYDYIIFYSDHHSGANSYQPFLFLNELNRINYKKILYCGMESRNVVLDYNNIYKKLFK